MAESPSSTSPKPLIQNLGLQLLIPLSDPISTQNVPDATAEENAEEVEFRNAIERELCQLTIEIETARQRLEAIDDADADEEATSYVGTVRNDDIDEEKDSESVEEDGGNVEVKATNVGMSNQSNYRRRTSYPMRPDAEDCGYYMKFGSCKFGAHCKFNHPPRRKNQNVKERPDHREENSQRAGQTECKYFLTSGGCKFGNDCKFSHGSDKSSTSLISELNFLGLPVRPGEKECPYYMRTGSCKYGSSCRFHHPDPTTVNGVDSPSGYGSGGSLPSQLVSSSPVSSWSPPRAFNDASPFVPVMFPPSQGAPSSNPEWNGYQAVAYPTSERSLPTPPAFAINNLPAELNFPMRRHQHDLVGEEYPERPGEPECSFFLKTGDCKFKSNCKFHHPKNNLSKPKANTYSLNDKGLPIRPDQPICTHYHRYGICKYGPACKYDHPSQFAILSPPFERPPFVDGAERRNES
ncbi:hypothetical protein BUALT_Bualt02G0085000 [Buddleja alternifolia]|uniref:C3H1-type domain-containing protein n=1 Tax=Buddleja alternifolia TaxID=168488 RepID=A0AAV6Y5A2_9LAMI|nr:hypothetical protein BUALT_Bualt02G0085000 [Buddleja alternifolia]